MISLAKLKETDYNIGVINIITKRRKIQALRMSLLFLKTFPKQMGRKVLGVKPCAGAKFSGCNRPKSNLVCGKTGFFPDKTSKRQKRPTYVENLPLNFFRTTWGEWWRILRILQDQSFFGLSLRFQIFSKHFRGCHWIVDSGDPTFDAKNDQ